MEGLNRMKGLLLVDVQEGFNDPSWGRRNNIDAEKNISFLLAKWRTASAPVIHVQHGSSNPNSPLHPDKPGFCFMHVAEPKEKEPVFRKTVNSAFIGTTLHDYLVANGISSLVIVGFTTDHCISTTVRMAGNLGYAVELISDATATFDRVNDKGMLVPAEQIQEIHLLSLDNEFCVVKTSSKVQV